MRKFVPRRRPSSSLTISLVALVVAVSGTAVAATKLMRGDDLIAKNSLSGDRLFNKTVTGQQINLSSLGKVPSAASADRAAVAAASDQIRSWFATASVGQTVTLRHIGPFKYTGACTGTATAPIAQTYVQTNQANSAADSYAGESGYNKPVPSNGEEEVPFNPADGPISVGYASTEASGPTPSTSPQWVGPYDGSDTQLSGDGHTLVNTFAAVGTLIHGADCTFMGHAIVIRH